MANKVVEKQIRPGAINAFHDRNWEVLFVCFVFLVSLIATVGMVLISAFDPLNDSPYRILPAAALMIMVEIWLVFSLPFYNKLAFWGAIIFLGTYLFFAVPFAFLGLLPTAINIGVIAFIVISLICGLLLYRQKNLFLHPAWASQKDEKR